MTLSLASVLGRWLDVVAATFLFGSTLYPLYAPTGRYLDRPLRTIVIAASVAGLLAAVFSAAILLFALEGGDPGSLRLGEIAEFFLASIYGRNWLGLLALWGLAIVLAICLRRNSWTVRIQARVLALVAATILVEQSLIGAAPEVQGVAGWALRTSQALHLLAAGAWIGGLVPLALVLIHSPRAHDAGALGHAARALRRFALMSASAAALIVLTGLVDAVGHLGEIGNPASTDYGRLLALKVAGFIAMALIAAWRLRAYAPRFVGPVDRRSLALPLLTIAAEGVIGLAVIGAALMLATLPQP